MWGLLRLLFKTSTLCYPSPPNSFITLLKIKSEEAEVYTLLLIGKICKVAWKMEDG